MKFSSCATSELNLARIDFKLTRKLIGIANKGEITKSFAMRNFNQSKKRLKDICDNIRGIPLAVKYSADFETTVAGIPCGVVIEGYSPGVPAKLFGLPENCYPAEPSELEFILVDRGGYRAQWLMDKLTDDDCARIEREYTS